jgi:hypothetical protein
MRVLILLLLVFSFQLAWAQEKSVPVKERFRLFKSKVNKAQKHDSLKLLPPSKAISELTNKADSAAQNFNQADTIRRPGFTNSKNPADSLKQKINSASENVAREAGAAQQKIRNGTDSLKVPDPLKSVQEKVNTGVNIPGLDKAGSVKSSIALPQPDKNPGNVNLPEVPATDGLKQGQLPDVTLPNETDNLPKADIPEFDAADKIKEKLPEHVPALDKPDSADVKKLTDKALADERLKEYAEPLQETSEKLDPYKKNLDSLNVQDATEIAAKEAEAALENTDALKTITENSQRAKAGIPAADVAMLQRYKDKRILKDDMLRKSKNVMNDKLTSISPQVKDQQQKLGKAKKMNSSVQSVKNIKEKRVDELRERPFYERIVPGISLQSYNNGVFALDFAPQIGYRLSTYLTAGAGAIYRVGFDRKYSTFASGQGVSGFRTFIDYRLVRGLFIHAEYERLTTSARFDYSENSATNIFNGAYLGLGKRYPISRKLYGGVIALYKIEMGDHLAGTSKFNLRLTFEYKTKKVRKPTDLTKN